MEGRGKLPGVDGCHDATPQVPPPTTRKPTACERRVYDLLTSRVPKGRVTSYAALAKALNSSARAVGGAMRRNPFAPAVPCHRVVCADGSLGGFSGRMDNPRKEALLREEGVTFVDAAGGRNKNKNKNKKKRVVDSSCFVKFE